MRTPNSIALALLLALVAGCDTGSRGTKDKNKGGEASAGSNSLNLNWVTIIDDVTPATGASSGGTQVVISGRNFSPASTEVFFGQAQATVVTITVGSITVVAPALTGATTPLSAPYPVDVLVTGGNNNVRRNSGFAYDDSNGGVGPFPGGALARIADYGDPSGADQELLELMNRARRDPTAEGTRLGLNLSAYPAKPPLSFNSFLAQAATTHTSNMIGDNVYGHLDANGDNANGRLLDTNYDLNGVYGTSRTANLSENIGVGSNAQFDTAEKVYSSFMIDAGLTPPKHRDAILGLSAQLGAARETGSSLSFGNAAQAEAPLNLLTETDPNDRLAFSPNHYADQEFARTKRDRSLIVGTVFTDTNGDGICNEGEGEAGVDVVLRHATGFTLTTQTATAGGYAFETLVDTDFEIEINGQKATVSMAADNTKVDSIGGTITTYLAP
jgi:hypothetical protein